MSLIFSICRESSVIVVLGGFAGTALENGFGEFANKSKDAKLFSFSLVLSIEDASLLKNLTEFPFAGVPFSFRIDFLSCGTGGVFGAK